MSSSQNTWARDPLSGHFYYDHPSGGRVYLDPRNAQYYWQDPSGMRALLDPRSIQRFLSHPSEIQQFLSHASEIQRRPDPRYNNTSTPTYQNGYPTTYAEYLQSQSGKASTQPPAREIPKVITENSTEPSEYSTIRSESSILAVPRLATSSAFQQSSRILSSTINTGRDSERLDPDFKLHSKAFFVLGRVFAVLWSEPAGAARSDVTSSSLTELDSTVISRIRRLVVIREGHESCTALPISTYGSRGLARNGVKKSSHGIIYTGKVVPELLPGEAPSRDERPMQSRPIRVIPDSPAEKLSPASRINYEKVYTIEFNSKAKAFGLVHSSCMHDLLGQFRDVFINYGNSDWLR